MLSDANIYALAQVIGAGALVVTAIAFQERTRSGILKRQIQGAVLFGVHYLLLGGAMGAAMAVIVALRDFVFGEKETHSWARHVLWLFFFLGLMSAALVVHWEGYISLLPVAGTALATYAFWQNDPKIIRIYMSGAASLWLPYAVYIGSYASLISHLVIIFSVNIAMSRLDRNGKPVRGHADKSYQAHTAPPYLNRKGVRSI